MNRKNIGLKMVSAFITFFLFSNALFSGTVSGELMPWHKVVVTFVGPEVSESSFPNPFTDYRVDVEFTGPSGQVYSVPGFFAADGNAGESSAESGSVWQVNFTPDEVGEWSYEASFVSGSFIAAELTGGTSADYFDGETGTFTVTENTVTDAKDYKGKGKLVYVDDHFLQFKGNGEYYIKGGANSPEVLLQYAEFDNTNTDRLYPDHIADWNDGDPTWKDGKGKGIIGSINYLASLDVNSFYFLTMNAYGDGKEAWPWLHKDSTLRYDVSKLEQWDILFQHMNSVGMMVHFVLTETENEAFFEITEGTAIDGFANSRKIYYREMVARYGYLPAVTWNVGEENGWEKPDDGQYQKANTDDQRKWFSSYLRNLTYYNDHISVHNGPSTDDYIFDGLLGHEDLTGPAFQWNFGVNIFDKILEWRNKSVEAGHKWVMFLDEPYVNPATEDLDEWRTENVWPTFMAGGAGIELYIGAGLDLQVQDFRVYEDYYLTMSVATNFLSKYVSLQEMVPDTDFSADYWTLRKADDKFLVYCKNASNVALNLPANNYRILWFNPRKGGAPTFGTVNYVDGGDATSVGAPLNETDNDWVCLIEKQDADQPQMDINIPELDETIEEGNTMELEVNELVVSNAGGGVLDTVNFTVENGDWLFVEKISFEDGMQTFGVLLNEMAFDLLIGEYNAVIVFNADNADAIFINYRLSVKYNLNGQKYYYLNSKIAVVEAESSDLAVDWTEATDVEGYSGDAYYSYTGSAVAEPSTENAINYFVYLPKSSTYSLALRTYNAESDTTVNNDFWVSIDDGDWHRAYTNKNMVWAWDTHFEDADGNAVDAEIELTEGFHKFSIHGKSPDLLFDKIHVYDTKIKDPIPADATLLPSCNAHHNEPLIATTKDFYVFNYTEGSIPSISAKTVKLTNFGTGTLGAISALANNDYVTLTMSGEGNAQEMQVNFNDNVEELTIGLYATSIVLSTDNASDFEYKLYYNIKQGVGVVLSELKELALVSNIVSSVLVFNGSIEGQSVISIYNTAGALVYSNAHFEISNNSIDISSLNSGSYILNVQNDNGYFNQKFIKE